MCVYIYVYILYWGKKKTNLSRLSLTITLSGLSSSFYSQRNCSLSDMKDPKFMQLISNKAHPSTCFQLLDYFSCDLLCG